MARLKKKGIPWTPAPYQERAVAHLVERNYSGLFLKPGMRKTSISLAAFVILQKLGMLRAILVLAPLRVCYTSWPQELDKWSDFSHLSVGILHGKNKDKVLHEKHDVYVMNYEGLEWLSAQLAGWKGPWPFDGLFVDESTKIKHTNTKRYKILKPMLPRFKRRYILTGSPMANGLLDLFGQVYTMDMGASFGPYISRWREEFFYPTGYGGYDWQPKADTEERIQKILAPRIYYAHDEDYLDLPKVIEKDVYVDLPPKAMAMYKQMENVLRLEFATGKVTAANTGVATMKCRQIANGGVYLDTAERTWQNIHEAKAEAVRDLVEELSGQPALVTYDFRHDLERLKKVLGKDTPHIGRGGVKPADMRALIESWNRGEVPVLIVSPQSMAHGVDGLQEAGRAVLWHSLDHNYEHYDQLVRRLIRSGQSERVLVAHIIANNTVDHAVMANIRSKAKGQNGFFKAMKDYWDQN